MFLLISPAISRAAVAPGSSDERVIDVPRTESVAVSADGTFLAAGDRDGLVQVFDIARGEVQAVLPGHTGWVVALDIAPDGSQVASVDTDQTVQVWNLTTLTQAFITTHDSGTITDVAFSPASATIAASSVDGTIWLGDATTGETIATLGSGIDPLWQVAFSPDGAIIAAGTETDDLHLWTLADGTQTTLAGDGGLVRDMAFVDDDRIITGHWDGTMNLWRISDRSVTPLMTLDAPLTALGYDAQTARVYAVGLDGSLAAVALDGGDVQQQSGAFVESIAFDMSTATGAAANVQADGKIIVRGRESLFAAQTSPVELDTAESESSVISGTLALPTAHVVSNLTQFPLGQGTWEIDPWESAVGHFYGTAWNTTGNIVLGGHSEYPDGGRGVFNWLERVALGDPIYLTVDGQQRRYRVIETKSVAFDDLSVVYPTTDERLTLITCDVPSYDPNAAFYWERLVVVAVLDS